MNALSDQVKVNNSNGIDGSRAPIYMFSIILLILEKETRFPCELESLPLVRAAEVGAVASGLAAALQQRHSQSLWGDRWCKREEGSRIDKFSIT